MYRTNVFFDIGAFESATKMLCMNNTGVECVAVCSSEKTVDALESALRRTLSPQDFLKAKIEKNHYGLPFVSMSNNVADARLRSYLVSATYDHSVALGIAAAVCEPYSSVRQQQPIGIGIDLMFHSTAGQLFTGCPAVELEQMFTKEELREAYTQPDQNKATQILLTKVSMKEAAFKSVSEAYFHNGGRKLTDEELANADFMDVEVTGMQAGRPKIRLSGYLRNIAEISGVSRVTAVAIKRKSYVGAVALAMGVRIGDGGNGNRDKKIIHAMANGPIIV
jgi:phosphopantetheine--protein transferase-like protein